MIEPHAKSILATLSDPNKVAVPRYQRNFTWGRNEAQELVEDINIKINDPGFNLFLGTVIFDVSKIDEKTVYVIDGQQRITTISVLLIACRQCAKKKAKELASTILERISFKDPYTGKAAGQRLIVSPSIKEIYDYITDERWKGDFPKAIEGKSVKKQVNKIKPLYDYFLNEIKDLNSQQLSDFVKSLYDAYFIRIDIENTSQAFDIFERMNARGVPLDVADLLKNHIFANLETTDIEEKWLEIVENSGGTPIRMLKYFWVSKMGYTKKSDLYKGIREYSRTKGAESLVKELEDFSYFYWVIREGEIEDLIEYLNEKGLTEITENESYIKLVFESIEALRMFRITQVYPVLYSAINAYQKQTIRKPKEFSALLQIFEKYHFINNVICERVGNEVEILYTKFAKDFNQNPFGSTVSVLCEELKSRLANKDEFFSNFTTLSYSRENFGIIYYVFDRINNNSGFKSRGGQRVKLFNPDPSITKKNFSIEHFLPQKNKKDGKINKNDLEAIDNIGNLLVISRHTNSDLGSMPPSEKIKALIEFPQYSNNLPYIRDFIEEYKTVAKNWDSKTIEQRAQKIAELGYKAIWSF